MKIANLNSEKGSAMLVALLLMIVCGVVMGGMLTMSVSTSFQTENTVSYETAYQAAEAGVHMALFEMESEMGTPGNQMGMSQYLQAHPGKVFSGDVGEASYTATLVSSGSGMVNIESVGMAPDGQTRTLRATLKAEDIKALDFSVFGNYVHFDNHNKVPFGVQLVSSIFSNSGLKIDPGIRIMGPATAVQYIEPSPASGSLPATELSPPGQQGDPAPDRQVGSALVEQAQPAPAVAPFPAFDFEEAQSLAQAQHREMSAGQFESLSVAAYQYAKSLTSTNYNKLVALPQSKYPAGVNRNFVPVNVIHHYYANPADGRFVRVPNFEEPENLVYLGSSDGFSTGPNHTYEVVLEGDPLPDNDTVFYLQGDLKLELPADVLLRVEGSLIVDGDIVIESGLELLAWENRTAPWFVPLGQTLYSFANNLDQVGPGDGYYDAGPKDSTAPPQWDVRYSRWPAAAANGKFKVVGGAYKDDTGVLTVASQKGGPVHMEGVIYSVAESHLHRSEPEGAAYSVGSEIADIIHNCQFFSFAYDPKAKDTLGFDNRISGREQLTLVRLTE